MTAQENTVAALGEALADLAALLHPTEVAGPVEPVCERCLGMGWLRLGVADVHDPDFGRLVLCPCQRDVVIARRTLRFLATVPPRLLHGDRSSYERAGGTDLAAWELVEGWVREQR